MFNNLPDFYNVVKKCAHGGHWERRGKQGDITKLYEHL